MGKITNSEEIAGARVTIPGVELVKVGTWGGHALNDEGERVEGSGGIQFTEAMLADMQAAANDPEMDESPLKFGHFSGRFDDEPAPGWLANAVLSEDKQTLIADIKDVPVALYPLIKTGFKRRSIECDFNVTSPSGAKYSAALTGLALLGVEAPAVKNLAEMAAAYASQQDTGNIPHPGSANLEDSNNDGAHGATENNEGVQTVELLEQLKEKLGLEAAATDEEVLAAVDAVIAASAAASDGAGDDEEDKGKAASLSAKVTQTVSSAKFSEMQAELKDLRAKEDARENEAIVEAALSEGKITTAEAPVWLQGLKDAKAPTKALLSSMPAQKINLDGTPLATKISDDDVAAKWAAQNS